MSIILGIDPGYKITGYGIIKKYKNNLFHIDNGSISLKNESNLFKVIKNIYIKISSIIVEFKPNYLVIEQIFVGKNFNSIIKLSYAKSAAIIASSNYNIPVFEYNSNKTKKIITGINNAKKNEIQISVKKILNLPFYINKDESDALAIAITHCFINKNC
ncbi:crossover junction endodeoxyribonuclease RuvC [endosymbiont of Sipalinus gigas]|uniref:crossover junction endodeoxyribonuclease RuvC n=1 Tax=endosymbiont of Sipalinus gigas TaxID=1972134 RepID=UPI000DC6DCAE|nr:crossover junction endodeoxyribonuclease RuvC [endosymbiont of Sipalinus gigas]BBA85226.1 crossover junction endodeoxyribonuclease RuvC [endosymbiont of Sipalinus gigas]